MTNQTDLSNSWRSEIDQSDLPKVPQLKIQDKEIVVVTFVDDGVKRTHPDFGESVRFSVKKQGNEEVHHWYVNKNNFDLLRQIKSLGDSVQGLKVEIRRSGTTKSNTRYFVNLPK